MLLKDGLRMSIRDPGSLSRANGVYFVVDHFLRDWRSMKNKKKVRDLGLTLSSLLRGQDRLPRS